MSVYVFFPCCKTSLLFLLAAADAIIKPRWHVYPKMLASPAFNFALTSDRETALCVVSYKNWMMKMCLDRTVFVQFIGRKTRRTHNTHTHDTRHDHSSRLPSVHWQNAERNPPDLARLCSLLAGRRRWNTLRAKRKIRATFLFCR
jgi:hypothetical protein